MFGFVRTIINIVFGVIEFLLALRFIFRFFSANPSAPFVSWIYSATTSLVSPFARILPDLKMAGFVLDFTTLFALIVYSLIGYLLLEIFFSIGSGYRRI